MKEGNVVEVKILITLSEDVDSVSDMEHDVLFQIEQQLKRASNADEALKGWDISPFVG